MPRNYKELQAEARALRQAGYSLRQIATRLELGSGTISRWVQDVPFEGFSEESQLEQLSTRREMDLYNRAVEMRKEGYSYNLISDELGVAKSTLSGWLRDVPFAEYHPHVQQRMQAATQAMAEARKKKAATLRAEARDEADKEVTEFLLQGLDTRDLFLMGLIAYWAEGSKSHSIISLTNSDPGIIQLFVRWVDEALKVPTEQLRGEVHLYPDTDIEEAEQYWSEVSHIQRGQFYPAQVDTRKGKSPHKRGTLKYGTFHVKVVGEGSTFLYHKILRWMENLGRYIEETMRV